MSDTLRGALTDPVAFAALGAYPLRGYQGIPARAIAAAVLDRRPGLLGMVFSRQAGKDETLAQLLAFLLLRHSRTGGEIVVAAPTRNPQANISRDRLLARLSGHPLTRGLVRVSDGNRVHVGAASAVFLSAAPGANARGHTASLLLVANEAQDIEPDTWDAVFDPMAASTNAPALFLGTVWTEDTLLARQMRYMLALEDAGEPQRLFLADWHAVAAELPAYGERVRERIAQLGSTHPFIRTEYELRELSGEGGMFGERRRQLMSGTHPRRLGPMPGETIALLVDVAGADEDATTSPGVSFDPGSRRDSTALTVVSIEQDDDLPHYRVLDRVAWTNVSWQTVEGAIKQAMRHWSPAATVIDSTGIGYGMWSRLASSMRGHRVVPFTFGSASKSALGWALLGIIDSGRLHDYAPDGDDVTAEYWRQVARTVMDVRSGPGRLLAFGVPASAGHDDLVLSLALVGVLEDLDLRPRRAIGRGAR